MRISANLSAETLQAMKKDYDIFSVERKNIQPKILHPAKLSFGSEGEIKFPIKAKAKGILYHSTSITRNVKRIYAEKMG